MIGSLRERFKSLLHMGESPDRLAMAFALGLFIAFSPLIGGHTLMAAGMIWAFRMNPVAVFAGTFVNNPWTFVPSYALCLWLGMQLWPGAGDLPALDIEGLTVSGFLTQMRPYLMPFLVGTTVMSCVSAVVGFVGLRWVIVNYRRRRAADLSD